MRVTMRAGVYLGGECFAPPRVEGQDVAAEETVSLSPAWAHTLVSQQRAVFAGDDVPPPAPPLTSDTITQRDPVATHRDPAPAARRRR